MNQELHAFEMEIAQCVVGNRGWVSCAKSRAAKCGIKLDVLHAVAEKSGLKVERHGKYGYCASRAS